MRIDLIGPPPRRRHRASWPRRPRRGLPSWPGPSALLGLAALVVLLAGCGVKGPPRPPGDERSAAPARPAAEPTPAPPATAPPTEGMPPAPGGAEPPAPLDAPAR